MMAESRLTSVACTISDRLTRVNRHPLMCLLFVPTCAAIIFFGWSVGQVQLTLLSLTTLLSIDASWTNRLTMLKMGDSE